MSVGNWRQWENRPDIEGTLLDRATGDLPEMESTKQLVSLVSAVYEPGMRVLDVGCNVGHYLRGLRRLNPQLDYTGVDAYSHYIEQARSIYARNPHARFEIRDIFDPLFPENPFDIVFCCNVLLHLPDFRQPMKNLIESTKIVCFVRLLLGESTTLVKWTNSRDFSPEGEPLDFSYQNTWQAEYFCEFTEGLGCSVELIRDEFDPAVLAAEYDAVKKRRGTRVVDGQQVDGNVIFNWTWARITPLG